MDHGDTALIPLPDGFQLSSLQSTATLVTAAIASQQTTAACPQCHDLSQRVHGQYLRTVADLPWSGRRVVLKLTVRKFVCGTPTCPQRIFTERLETFLLSHARMTNRLRAVVQALGMTTGGEGGERFAPKLGMTVSAPTLLRHMRHLPLPSAPPVSCLGVDDWAWKKGQTYGTILIDLDRHCPVEVLPDREASTVATWLQAHPSVTVISRDRAGAYADAARHGAPHAQQIADRFHLLKNVRETLQRVLERLHVFLPRLPEEVRLSGVPATAQGHGAQPLPQHAVDGAPSYRHMTAQPRLPPTSETPKQSYRRLRREQRSATYDTVRALMQQGSSQREIARRLHLSERTVARFVHAEVYPELLGHTSTLRRSILDPYKVFIAQRCQEGCWNGTQLYAELQEQGFVGSLALLRNFLTQLRKHSLFPNTSQASVPISHRPSLLDPFKSYLLQRWNEGCWNNRLLYSEICGQGFAGSHSLVSQFLARVRQQRWQSSETPMEETHTTVSLPSDGPPYRENLRRISARRAAWLLFFPVEHLTERQQDQREQVRTCHPEVEDACHLVQTFRQMLTDHQAEAVEPWLTGATQSALPEFTRFARHMARDAAAVQAACSSLVSNGQVEGQITRLKLLKRQMYGRANFDLLRLRVLYRE